MKDKIYILKDVIKNYGDKTACHLSYLEIYRGEVLGIIGPSGSGKSTLLRLLNFLERQTYGSIIFDGNTFDGKSHVPLTIRRRMTMVFQNPMLLKTSILNNVAYGLKLRNMKYPKSEAATLLRRLGMESLVSADASNISYGEAQRVALARALVLRPDVLLLDEPTANLDPYNVGVTEDLILRAKEESGATIVVVTHNVFQARRLCDRMVFLLDGKEVEVGPTEELFTHAKDPRTIAFIGGDMVY